jgi:uncharacterized membrane protein YfcA
MSPYLFASCLALSVIAGFAGFGHSFLTPCLLVFVLCTVAICDAIKEGRP